MSNMITSPKDEIKRIADIVDIIGEVVHLKRAGRNFVGLCPFHTEKDPSFTVNPERQTFHCFGCKKGGDLFDFWMEYYSTTFKEALTDLAERYNIPLKEYKNNHSYKKDGEYEKRRTIFRINKLASDFYSKQLKDGHEGEQARRYLEERQITEKTISDFDLGYAPDKWDGLTRILLKENIHMDRAVEAGLVKRKRSGGYYDCFRGRIMFPIYDLRNQIVGFGGRVIDNSLPKYINTPESPVFHKGETLYGLNRARDAIRKKGTALIVEGYMDLLALFKNGIDFCVATLGTALTPYHVRKLRGYTNEAVVVFDSDDAGKKAALRTIPIFVNEGVSASVVILPAGHDPDTFLNEKGAGPFLELIEKARPILDFYLDSEIKENDTEVKKLSTLKNFFSVLNNIESPAIKEIYIKRFSEISGLSEHVIRTEIKQLSSKKRFTPAAGDKNNRRPISKEKRTITDLQILNLMIHHPRTIERLMNGNCQVLLKDPDIISITETIYDIYQSTRDLSTDLLMEKIKDEGIKKVLREIIHKPFTIYSEDDVDLALTELEQKAKRKLFLKELKDAKGNIYEIKKLITSEAKP